MSAALTSPKVTRSRPDIEAIVIGASAGALEALSAILPALPSDFPLPLFVVIHLPSTKESLLAELLQSKCHLEVCEAEDKEPIRGGTIYLAPPDYHLMVETKASLSLSADEAVNYSRPSIDVLFETAADVYGTGLLGIVLTGANHDGSRGLRAVIASGGVGLIQDPVQAYASAMPLAAIEACPHARVLGLPEIAPYLLEMVCP